MVRSRGSYWRTRVILAVEMAASAGSTGPAIKRFEDAPHKLMVSFRAALAASASASSCGVRGSTAEWRNATCADFSSSGKPLLYAVERDSAKPAVAPYAPRPR